MSICHRSIQKKVIMNPESSQANLIAVLQYLKFCQRLKLKSKSKSNGPWPDKHPYVPWKGQSVGKNVLMVKTKLGKIGCVSPCKCSAVFQGRGNLHNTISGIESRLKNSLILCPHSAVSSLQAELTRSGAPVVSTELQEGISSSVVCP